ncbi:hypothetical protein Q1695_000175 [Nippostrongylus brasiliensis]|nr:hypothetical protein Q1695_000175 [Nippostrongylus brasiliensis]
MNSDKENRTPKANESKKKGKNDNLTKVCLLSEELQSVVGARFLRRCDVISKMWQYIKANKLLDPKNKRFCLVDDKLKGVFGPCKRFRAFSMARPLAKHIRSPEEARLTAEYKVCPFQKHWPKKLISRLKRRSK